MTNQDHQRFSTAEAARKLGVKPATIYAYVSRGVLTSHPSTDGKGSTFSSTEIELLARKGKPRQASRPQALDFTITTSITEITQKSLKYRGLDVIALSKRATFEQVTDLLLTGSLPSHKPWPTHSAGAAPAMSAMFDHLIVTSMSAAQADPFRQDLDPRSVTQVARTLISSVVDSMPATSKRSVPKLRLGEEDLPNTIAGRLWNRLSPNRPSPGMLETLNSALVLMADHELATSAVGARVAASTRADPYAVVAAGAAVMSGPLHGGASRPARQMLDRALETGDPNLAASEALQQNGMYPGFGHKVYKQGDPRADALLSSLRSSPEAQRSLDIVDQLTRVVWRRREVHPNIDLALAAMGMVGGFPIDSGERIFGTARIAGWLAHAIEEYAEAPVRFRARGIYEPS